MVAPATQRAARLIAGGAALLSGAVLADSAIEHYRGSFDNRAMPLPLAGSALALGIDAALAATGSVAAGCCQSNRNLSPIGAAVS